MLDCSVLYGARESAVAGDSGSDGIFLGTAGSACVDSDLPV